MARPPAGYSVSKGAYFDADGQGPYAWDGASMRLLGSGGLGTFTWAALQAAYPNGGGALAALPAGVTAFVSDWGAEFTPNAAKTRWRPKGGILRVGNYPVVSNVVNDNAIKFMAEVVIPAGLLEIDGIVAMSSMVAGSADANSKIFRHGLATASGATGGTSPSGGATLNSATNLQGQITTGFRVEAYTNLVFSANVLFQSIANQSWAFNNAGVTVNLEAAPLYLPVTGQLAIASTSMTLNGGVVTYWAPVA